MASKPARAAIFADTASICGTGFAVLRTVRQPIPSDMQIAASEDLAMMRLQDLALPALVACDEPAKDEGEEF